MLVNQYLFYDKISGIKLISVTMKYYKADAT